MTQYNLLHQAVSKPTDNIGNSDVPLLWLVHQLDAGEIIPPYFQRNYVWEEESGKSKVEEWIYSILAKNAIGVIVTYQLPSGGTTFLADGLQRLSATKRFIESPSYYGFGDISTKDAEKKCAHFLITRQHRIYNSHEEARKAFQNLNKGTSLTPQEFFKGELTRTDLGMYVHERLPQIVDSLTRSIVTRQSVSRERQHILIRNSFSLFLQYITGLKKTSFWHISSNKVNMSSRIVEADLAIWLGGKARNEVEKSINSFENFIASKINHIIEIRKETGQDGKSFSSALLRWLLHLSIWVKNNSVPISEYENFVKCILTTQRKKRNLSSKIIIDISETETADYTTGLNELSSLNKMSEYLGCSIHLYPIKRINGMGDKGKDLSHTIPISQGGNNSETFYESATKNRARGAQQVCEQKEKDPIGD